MTELGYCATEAVLGVHGVLRVVHSDLHLLTDVAVLLCARRSSGPLQCRLTWCHSVAAPRCQPTVCTRVNMPSAPKPWGDGLAANAPFCLRRRRWFDGLLDRLLLVKLVPFLTCWRSALGPEHLTTSLLHPPSTRRAVGSHCGFSGSRLIHQSAAPIRSKSSPHRCNGHDDDRSSCPPFAESSLCLLLLRVRAKGPWSRYLASCSHRAICYLNGLPAQTRATCNGV